ncbi:unnamed protein product [Rotaria sp. Silwood1]|nr:unnamed protein product [Rotaria sp. Silwood1]
MANQGPFAMMIQEEEIVQYQRAVFRLLTFAIPSSLILRLLGATRYLSLSLISWGAITIGMAFVTNARQLIVLRFLLGMVIAGYFPGIITYFSLWYPKREQIMRIAIFCTATFGSGALVGILVIMSIAIVQRVEDKLVSRQDHIIAIGFLVGALIMTLILRICLMMENRRREYLSNDDYNREATIEEPCDWVNIEDIFA